MDPIRIFIFDTDQALFAVHIKNTSWQICRKMLCPGFSLKAAKEPPTCLDSKGGKAAKRPAGSQMWAGWLQGPQEGGKSCGMPLIDAHLVSRAAAGGGLRYWQRVTLLAARAVAGRVVAAACHGVAAAGRSIAAAGQGVAAVCGDVTAAGPVVVGESRRGHHCGG